MHKVRLESFNLPNKLRHFIPSHIVAEEHAVLFGLAARQRRHIKNAFLRLYWEAAVHLAY